jgi:hypothetical protein
MPAGSNITQTVSCGWNSACPAPTSRACRSLLKVVDLDVEMAPATAIGGQDGTGAEVR